MQPQTGNTLPLPQPEAEGAPLRDYFLDVAITGLKAVFARPGGTGEYGLPNRNQWQELPLSQGKTPEADDAERRSSLWQYFDERWNDTRPPQDDLVEAWREDAEENNVPLSLFIDTMGAIQSARRELAADPTKKPATLLPDCLQFPTPREGVNESIPEPAHIAFLREFATEALGYPPNPGSQFGEVLAGLRNYNNQGNLIRFCTDPSQILRLGERYDTQLPVLEAFRSIASEDLESLGAEYLDSYDALFDTDGEDFDQHKRRELKREVFIETGGKYHLSDLEAYEDSKEPLLDDIRESRRWMVKLLNESVTEYVPEFTEVPNKLHGPMDSRRLAQTVVNIRAREKHPLVRRTQEHVPKSRNEILGRRDFILGLDVSGSMGTTTEVFRRQEKDRFRFKPIERLVDWLEERKIRKSDRDEDAEQINDKSPAEMARDAVVVFAETIAAIQPVVQKFEREHGVTKGTLAMKTMLVGFGFFGTPKQEALRQLTSHEINVEAREIVNTWATYDRDDQEAAAQFVERYENLFEGPYTEQFEQMVASDSFGAARTVKPIGAELTTLDKLELYNMWDLKSGAGWGTPADKAMTIALEQARVSARQKRKPVYIHVTDGESGTPIRDQELLLQLRKLGANVRCIVIGAGEEAAKQSGFTDGEITAIEDASGLSKALKAIQQREMREAVTTAFGLAA